jgi:succinate-semialdehyde dehydrogenase/glutarate-semialdehyde dehydrogenase
MQLLSRNPATGETIAAYPQDPDHQVSRKIAAARDAGVEWARASFTERGRPLRKAAAILGERKDDLARLMANEMGKPVQQGLTEIEKCALTCEHFAENAERHLQPEEVPSDASRSYVCFPPLGTVLAVMPWNFPFWQAIRCAAPALMAGNALLLKHASNVTGCALALDEIFRGAGFPPGVFGVLLLDSSRLKLVVAHPDIRGVTLTGSVEAGKSLGALAGAALKKTVMELGGSDPYLILGDADPAAASEVCARSRLINSGQSCIAAKRFIVVESLREPFMEGLASALSRARCGDPLDPATEVGPLARFDLRDALHDQVQRSIDTGARCQLGGRLPSGPGAFYPPTLLGNVCPGMAAFAEETFGPVAAVITASDDAEAIRLANQSAFGLGAAVFTRDKSRGAEIAANQLNAGACFVNTFVRSDPRLPFGGIKDSGYGRELGSFGLREFVNVKTVYVA